ncbi:hypothetical protein [uncultured Enterovirga sp.]|uniref:hypothetical protein n=1 Tax=uncultured Enterovirga sp. TaxID=2026352 RepID=UPI0035CAD2AF
MSKTLSCPMGHASLRAQRDNPEADAGTSRAASPASSSRPEGVPAQPAPAAGGWWAFAAQARAAMATA